MSLCRDDLHKMLQQLIVNPKNAPIKRWYSLLDNQFATDALWVELMSLDFNSDSIPKLTSYTKTNMLTQQKTMETSSTQHWQIATRLLLFFVAYLDPTLRIVKHWSNILQSINHVTGQLIFQRLKDELQIKAPTIFVTGNFATESENIKSPEATATSSESIIRESSSKETVANLRGLRQQLQDWFERTKLTHKPTEHEILNLWQNLPYPMLCRQYRVGDIPWPKPDVGENMHVDHKCVQLYAYIITRGRITLTTDEVTKLTTLVQRTTDETNTVSLFLRYIDRMFLKQQHAHTLEHEHKHEHHQKQTSTINKVTLLQWFAAPISVRNEETCLVHILHSLTRQNVYQTMSKVIVRPDNVMWSAMEPTLRALLFVDARFWIRVGPYAFERCWNWCTNVALCNMQGTIALHQKLRCIAYNIEREREELQQNSDSLMRIHRKQQDAEKQLIQITSQFL